MPAQEHSRKPYLGDIARRVLTGVSSNPVPEPWSSPGPLGSHPNTESNNTSETAHGSVSQQPVCQYLEVFGRELRPGWDVVGNEVLAFQELRLFKQASETA